MKTVRDLTREQLNELKQTYAIILKEDCAMSYQELSDATNISDDVIFEHYEGITFTDDDFFCTSNNKEEKDMDWKEKFYEKLAKEREAFQESYKTMEYIQIYNDYYIIGFYESIYEILTNNLTQEIYEQILIWLSEKENPLEFLYKKWERRDGSFSFDWDETMGWIYDEYLKE